MGVLAAWLIVGSVFVFGYQVYVWVLDGTWSSLSLLDLWVMYGGNPPHSDWKGWERLATWLLDLPLAFSCLAAGLAIGFFTVRVEVLARRRSERARRQLGT